MHNIPHSEKAKKRISESLKGRKGYWADKHLTRKHRRNLSESLKGIKNPMFGICRSLETREKIGKSRKGKGIGNQNGFKKGQIAWNKNTKGVIKSNSGSFKKGENMGEKSWNWKDGITPINTKIRTSIESRLWREAVFARDSWTCQKCGDRKGGNLNSHHIQNFAEYPELRLALDNGITLCQNCHRKFHKKYGQNNNTLKQLIEFLKVESMKSD